MTFFGKIEHRFQVVPDDRRILIEPFIRACQHGIIPFLESLGTTFIPVKSDVAGNIDKLEKKFLSDREKFPTINDMLDDELKTNSTDLARIGGLWLKRGLQFICALLILLIEDHKTGNDADNLGPITRQAYEQTLKKFHGWFTQKMISGVTRTLPSRKNFLKTLFDPEVNTEDQLFTDMSQFLAELTANVEVLNELFIKLNLDDQVKVN